MDARPSPARLDQGPWDDQKTDSELLSLVGSSGVMLAIRQRIRLYAPTTLPVLLGGETGSGKGLCARLLHAVSGLSGPLVELNCANLHESLVESQLFGHERGAFTGATHRQAGLLAEANGGSLFLDEIADLPMAQQAKLLRALENGEYRSLGSSEQRHSRFRLIAATSADLQERVRTGTFRNDLYFRLGAIRIDLPPLRDRSQDVVEIAEALLRRLPATVDGKPWRLSDSAVEYLLDQPWPGNVRQLASVLEAAAVESRDCWIEREHLEAVQPVISFGKAGPRRSSPITLEEVIAHAERDAISSALQSSFGSRAEAARALGISPATLYRKLSRTNGDGSIPVDSSSATDQKYSSPGA